ncbi:MAG: DUF2231 domain-containing protein [Elusimicrobia bacterium]|nr:DUF2231 domain-containing protein [Elusimicrobiota bacterium]
MIVNALRRIVMETYLHPVLVNFTAALVPVSVFCDLAARGTGKDSLSQTGRWTMLFAGAVTPLTAITGWLFWMKDDVGVRGMAIHKWLGTALALLIPALALWRARTGEAKSRPSALYLGAALVLLAALVLQGHLGGVQVFSDM